MQRPALQLVLVAGLVLPVLLGEYLLAFPAGPDITRLRHALISVAFSEAGRWCLLLGSTAVAAWRFLRPPQGPPDLPFLGFTVLAATRTAIAAAPGAPTLDESAFVAAIALAALTAPVLAPPANPDTRDWIQTTCRLAALFSLTVTAFPCTFHFQDQPRLTGLWNNPNTCGLAMAAFLAWNLAAWIQPAEDDRPNLGRWQLITHGGLAAIVLAATYSRGAWLATLMALTLTTVLHLRTPPIDRRTFQPVPLLLATAAIAAVFALSAPRLGDRVRTLLNPADRSWVNRLHAANGALQLTLAQPLAGWGLDRLETPYLRHFAPPDLREPGAILLNDPLRIAAGLGLPGLALFSWILLQRRPTNPTPLRTLAPLVALGVGSVLDGVLFRPALALPFWLLVLSLPRRLPPATPPSQPDPGPRPKPRRWLRAPDGSVTLAQPLRRLRELLRPLRRQAAVAALTLAITLQLHWNPDLQGGWRPQLHPRLRAAALQTLQSPTVPERVDRLQEWLHREKEHVAWHEVLGPAQWPAQQARQGCRGFCEAFVELARAANVTARLAWTFWPTIGNDHFWVEVWDPETEAWHSCDVSEADRTWATPWMHRIPKAVSLVPRNGASPIADLESGRWENLRNTIAAHYPSGEVRVRVHRHGAPFAGARVVAEVWLGDGMGGSAPNAVKFHRPALFPVLAALTDASGNARLQLGESAERAYRIRLDQGPRPDWAWVIVRAGHRHPLVLDADRELPFDPTTMSAPRASKTTSASATVANANSYSL